MERRPTERMIANDKIGLNKTGVPILAVGSHCPICAAPMYIGRDDTVLVCPTHGEMSPGNYAYLWHRLCRFTVSTTPPSPDGADKYLPVSRETDNGRRVEQSVSSSAS